MWNEDGELRDAPRARSPGIGPAIVGPIPKHVLMYSHDTFGLGHLRRSRAIAGALTAQFPALTVSILTGSRMAGAFPEQPRIAQIPLPPVRKRVDGSYGADCDERSYSDTLAARQAIIRAAAERVEPDLIIVDKEPLGLDGEMLTTLKQQKRRGAAIVLGLRDVLDDPGLLSEEWRRKCVLEHLDALYDQIWVYGPKSFHDPLAGLDLPAQLRRKVHHTGFLPRARSSGLARPGRHDNFVLVTVGGGGDGFALLSALLNALAHRTQDDLRFLIAAGPLMPAPERRDLAARSAALANVRIVDFDAGLQDLVAGCRALIAMCGYNTFCEALSFDKPALYVPRTRPRREQLIRALRAASLGWADMLAIEEACDPHRLLAAIEQLLCRAPPSSSANPIDLSGLERICDLTRPLLSTAEREPSASVSPCLSNGASACGSMPSSPIELAPEGAFA